MKRITLFSLALGIISSLFAAQVSVKDAQDVAYRFMTKNGALRSTATEWQLAWSGEEPGHTRNTGDAPFYLFTSAAGGFVVVAGDDLVTPILGYSDSKEFKIEGMPENIRGWFGEYSRQIAWARNQSSYYDPEAAADWKALRNGTYHPLITRAEGSKLIPTAEWDQGAPYNDLCPELNGQRCFTGCVATAMAIHLKTIKYPTNITPETITYTTETHGINVSRTLSSSYDWSDAVLPMKYNESSTVEQNTAVANLMADCGAVAKMNYGPEGSSAWWDVAVAGMIRYFKYDKSAEYQMYDWYTPDDWDVKIQQELNAGRPIFYYGADDFGKGAHQFILDGYKPGHLYHFNWGWGGAANGDFKLSALTPEGSNYSYFQNAYFNLKADEGGQSLFSAYLTPDNQSPEIKGLTSSVTEIQQGVVFDITAGRFLNNGLDTLEGNLLLIRVNSEDELVEKVSNPLQINLYPKYSYQSLAYKVTVNKEIVEGDRIVLAFTEDDQHFEIIQTRGSGMIGEILLKKSVGIEQSKTEKTKVYATSEGICVKGESIVGKTIAVFGLEGSQHASVKAVSSSQTLRLPTGTYIVKVGTQSHKVVVAK